MKKRQWLFHKTKPAKIFNSAEEIEKALADGWFESPVEVEHENVGTQVPVANDQKQDETKPEQTPSENEAGKPDAKPKPIQKENYVKWSVKKLKDFLVESGVKADELKGLEKDELIAKIGELGK